MSLLKQSWLTICLATSIGFLLTAPMALAQYTCTDEFGRSYSGNTIRDIQQTMAQIDVIPENCDGTYAGETKNEAGESATTSQQNNSNTQADSGMATLPQPKESPPAEPGEFSRTVFIDGYLIPPECLGNAYVSPKLAKNKPCDVNAMLLIGINISRLILATIGSVALIMFIYGGILFVLAAGNTSRIDQGKTILINAVIGITIILFSWIAINTLVAALTGTDISDPKIFEDQSPLSQ